MKPAVRNPQSKSFIRRDDGSNLIEFAVTLVVYLLMLFAVIDFSRALYAYHFVGHAAREGARWAIVNGSACNGDGTCPYASGAQEADVSTYVKKFIPRGINSGQVTVTAPCGVDSKGKCAGSPVSCPTTADGSYNAPGCVVQVTVSYPFHFLVPLLSTATINMSSTSEMVIAH